MTTTTKRPRGARTKLRRRVAGLLALGFGLLSAGMLFAAFAPTAQTAQAQQRAPPVRGGEQFSLHPAGGRPARSRGGGRPGGPARPGAGPPALYSQPPPARRPRARRGARPGRSPARLPPGETTALRPYF